MPLKLSLGKFLRQARARAAEPDAAKREAVPPSGIKRAAAAGSAESGALAVSFTPTNVSSKPATDWKEGVCWLSSSTQGNACEANASSADGADRTARVRCAVPIERRYGHLTLQLQSRSGLEYEM